MDIVQYSADCLVMCSLVSCHIVILKFCFRRINETHSNIILYYLRIFIHRSVLTHFNRITSSTSFSVTAKDMVPLEAFKPNT